MSSLRTAASLLVVAPSSKILFMLRPAAGTFPSTHVFPGGSYDQATDPSLEYTALRETYEETGLLLGPKPNKPVVHAIGEYPSYESALKHVFGKDMSNLNDQGGSSSSSSQGYSPGYNQGKTKPWWSGKEMGLGRISNWTTPAHIKKRFSTQFYVCSVDSQFEFPELPPISSAPQEKGADTHHQHQEVELLEWLTPYEALSLFDNGKIKLMPPQFYILTAIHEYGLQGAIERLQDRVFAPKVLGKTEDGSIKMDWGRGEMGVVKFNKNGAVDKIKFVRASI